MEYTRLTIQGSRRRADVVVPDDEPVEALLGEILELLDEPTEGARPIVLATLAGEQLVPSLTLDEQGVRHGTRLRVTPIDEAPPAPDVVEVTEAVSEAAAARTDRWGTRHAGIVIAAAAAGLGAIASSAIASAVSPHPALLLLAVALVAGGAIAAARMQRPLVGDALAAAAVGSAWVTAEALTSPGLVRMLVFVGIAALVVGGVAILGFRALGPALGAAVLVVLAAGIVVGSLLGMSDTAIASCAAVAVTLAIGLLPGLALAASGLTRFDDRVVEGGRVSRSDVASAIDHSFSTLTSTVLAAAAIAGLTATMLVLGEDGWGAGVGGAVALVLALRARMLPLGPQRVAVLLAALVPAIAWLAASPVLEPTWRIAAALVLLCVLALVSGITTTEHGRARLRRWATTFEMLGVLTMVPLLLGAFGVFSDLLGAFR